MTSGTIDVSGASRHEQPRAERCPGLFVYHRKGRYGVRTKCVGARRGIVVTRPGGLARRRTRMDNTLRHGMAGRHENSRRQFLRDVVTGGVAVVASASLPAGAQETADLRAGRNQPLTGPVPPHPPTLPL